MATDQRWNNAFFPSKKNILSFPKVPELLQSTAFTTLVQKAVAFGGRAKNPGDVFFFCRLEIIWQKYRNKKRTHMSPPPNKKKGRKPAVKGLRSHDPDRFSFLAKKTTPKRRNHYCTDDFCWCGFFSSKFFLASGFRFPRSTLSCGSDFFWLSCCLVFQ